MSRVRILLRPKPKCCRNLATLAGFESDRGTAVIRADDPHGKHNTECYDGGWSAIHLD
jgi:hypothetical protein